MASKMAIKIKNDEMNKEMQEMVEGALDTLEGRNSTDIYNAIKEAISMVMARDDKTRAP